MPCLFVTYLLGVWLLLSQLPGETTAGLLENLRQLLCNNPLMDQLEKKCIILSIEGSNDQDESALQQRKLSGKGSCPTFLPFYTDH